MPGKPLDNEFRFLTEEAKRLRAAFLSIRSSLEQQAGPAGAPGSTTGGPAARSPNAGAIDAQAAREAFSRQAKEFVKTIAEVQRSVRAGGNLAKSLGLGELGRHLDVAANKLETVHAASEGLGASLKVLRAAFLPVAVGAAAVVGPLLLVQKVFESASGKALSFTETIQVMGLSLAKLAATVGGDVMTALGMSPESISEATISAQALQEQINEIVAKAKEPGSAGTDTASMLRGLLGDVVAQVEKLVALVPETDSALGALVQPQAFQDSKEAIAAIQLELAKLSGDQALVDRFATKDLEAQLAPLIAQANKLGEALWNGGQVSVGAQERLDLINKEIMLRRQLLDAQLANETMSGQLASFFTQAGNVANATFDVITQGVQAVGATVANTLLDAFLDPQADIRESFSQLFRQLAAMILQTITQLLIAKAIAAAIGGAGGGAGGIVGAVIGAAQGGRSDRMKGNQPSLAHLFAQGLALGGRPKGLPATDTIAAWLSPGEFVIPAGPTSKLTPRSLEALRRGAISAGALDALAAGYSLPARAALPSISYADGGPVTAGGGGVGGGMGTVQVAPSETNLARQLAGGHGALVRHFRENASALKSALGVRG
jgi:hypothetical protein